MKEFTKNALTVFCSFLFSLLLAEVTLRFLPVNESLCTQPVNEKNPVIHFAPNRTSTWSRFADFTMVNEVHSNNYGYLNDQDYALDDEHPLLAIIGDSYVEASMVPYSETMHGRLAQELEDWRVYSFGISGAPLSQYLIFAQFARTTFHPEKMAFVIIANDYDESLLRYKNSPGLHFFQRKNNQLELVRQDYSPSFTGAIVSRSRLAMYLLTNAKIQHQIANLFNSSRQVEYVGQTSAKADTTRLALSKDAVERFLELLPQYAGLPSEDIFFIVDGLRPDLYTEKGRKGAVGSYAEQMRKFFMDKARSQQYTVVDMQPIFEQHYAANGNRFEFKKDGHWNGIGHGVAADALKTALGTTTLTGNQ